MRSENTKKIIKSIAYENNLTYEEVYEIVKAPFSFLVETMRSADRENLEFPSVRIKYFATFYCSENRKKYFKRIKERANATKERGVSTRAEIIPVFTEGDG